MSNEPDLETTVVASPLSPKSAFVFDIQLKRLGTRYLGHGVSADYCDNLPAQPTLENMQEYAKPFFIWDGHLLEDQYAKFESGLTETKHYSINNYYTRCINDN